MNKNKRVATTDRKFHWMAAKLVLVISFIFLIQLIFPQFFEIFILRKSEVIFQPWTLVTYIFLHGSYLHLYSNMFALFIFSSILEKVIGYKNFLKVFFFTGIVSGLISIFFYDSVIGASGAIFGIIGTLALLRPKMVVWGLGIPMYMMVVIIVYAVLDLAGVFYPDDIAHIGHLSALALGIIIGIMWKKKYGIVEKKKKPLLSEEEFRRWEDKYMKRKK
jgi:hypothetical protein